MTIPDIADGLGLVDITAIAGRLGVPKDTVNKWRYRGLLPAPDFDLSVGPIWEWETIESWAQSTGRLPETAPDQD